jgi:hypothetical protein
MELPVPEWAYQLVVGKLLAVLIYLWNRGNRIIDELVKKVEEARDGEKDAKDALATAHEAHAKAFQELFEKTQEE